MFVLLINPIQQCMHVIPIKATKHHNPKVKLYPCSFISYYIKVVSKGVPHQSIRKNIITCYVIDYRINLSILLQLICYNYI